MSSKNKKGGEKIDMSEKPKVLSPMLGSNATVGFG